MAKKPRTGNTVNFVRDAVPEGQLKRLIAKSHAHSKSFAKSRVRYPDPDKLDSLTLKAIQKLGFIDHELQQAVPLNAKGKKGGGKGGNGGSQKGGKKLPDANVVLTEVQNAINNAGLQPVALNSDAKFAEFNMENCDETKVRYFASTYQLIFSHADVGFLVEVTTKAVMELAKLTGYRGYCSSENSRGQAVGFIVNPARFDVIGQAEVWAEVASVQGIPDLRPAYKITVKDKVTGLELDLVVVHLKSMRGGPKVTGPVRKQQFQKIAARLGTPVSGCKAQLGKYQLLQMFKNVKIGRGLSDHGVLYATLRIPANVQAVNGMKIIAGDFNDFIDTNSAVTAPLTSAGYKLMYPHDSTSTQSMGGRLDGFFRDVSSGTACSGSGTGEFADNSTDQPTVVSLRPSRR